MVKSYTHISSYDYPFPTVTLAYYLRYPNPFSTHVISTDVIERNFDAETQRLTTTRLHLKQSRLPATVLALIPKSLLGSTSNTGDSQSYILERSTVDVRLGWMMTESRNLDFTKVLSVVERQEYKATGTGIPSNSPSKIPVEALAFGTDSSTSVTTTVQLTSRIGQRFNERASFFTKWSQSSIQRSIEAIGLSRTNKSQPNAKEGMKIVLERLRDGGLVGVLEGMRRDREQATGFHVSGAEDHRSSRGH